MAEIYLTSDPHFSHENIIAYTGRPFFSAREMDEALIQYWNETVRPGDHVWCLGDVSMDRKGSQQPGFIKLIKRLHGQKRLVLGNHDHFPVSVYEKAGFQKIRGVWGGLDHLLFTHIPVHPNSMGRFVANVHGHIHEKPAYPPVVTINRETQEMLTQPYVNVSVEQTNYRPIHLDEVKRIITQLGGTLR